MSCYKTDILFMISMTNTFIYSFQDILFWDRSAVGINWKLNDYSLTDPVFTPGIPCKRNWINDLKPCCVKNIIML